MTEPVDICNRALSELGVRATISNLVTDTSPAAVNCNFHYGTLRQQLIRCAPWGFCRKTLALTLLGQLSASPPTSPYPWMNKYAYPADCLKLRYVLPTPCPFPVTDSVAPVVGAPVVVTPWFGPSRNNRFLIANDDTSGTDNRVILSNVCNALGVYNKDVQSPDMWDPLFQDAMVASLAYKVCLALTGKAALKEGFKTIAETAIINARLTDGNEALPTVDHMPDWIKTRGAGSAYGMSPFVGFDYGNWYCAWDNMSWGA